jgi:Ser/Thr protein kinase RdoA (MazF antagonist)
MRFVAGQPVMYPDHPPADPLAWAAEMGKMLAAIHSVPCRPIPPFLQDDNALALYFLRSGAIPDYLKADPDGIRIWRAVLDHLPDFTRTKTALIHLDFWAGNLLWEAGRISAVVDWEEAGYGDPGIDVAYCQMDLILAGQPEAARAFLQAYEDAMGCPTANLNFWKLAAAVRPILQPQGWIDASPFQERFRQFVTEALQALASTPPNAASEPEPATIAEILEDQALWSEAEKRVQTAENQTPISSKQVMRAFGISESDLDDIDVDIE